MGHVSNTLLPDYWINYSPSKSDIDFISNYLFETEFPLTDKEIVPILVDERIRAESDAFLKKQLAGSKIYLPEANAQVGDKLIFPSLEWQKGKVVSVRPGVNPSIGEFDVVEVELETGLKRKFASRLTEHKLNQLPEISTEEDSLNPAKVIAEHSKSLETTIAKGLKADHNLVQIAGRWFPRALLVDINVGHLNLAEAILEDAGGTPLLTGAIIEQVALKVNENPNLIEFSMNYALQEDGRFDEVGPAGEVLWCLKRLEPVDVQQIPPPLRYVKIPYDRSILTTEMISLEAMIDDELGEGIDQQGDVEDLTISLTYPHWRAGTLPVSVHTRKLFPTAYESERVRFPLIDAISKEEIPAWIVRHHGYVSGLSHFYQKYGLIPGSLLKLRRGTRNGQVIVEAKIRRPMRDWIRTVLVGSDGGIVFANLKQNLTTEFNERMVVAVPDVAGVDAACEQITKQRIPFEHLVANMMKELTKLNVQGNVHAQELYSALNIIRRCPVGPLLAHLSQMPIYKHVGDLHYRIIEQEG